MHVFISYKRDHQPSLELAKKLQERLESRGQRVFRDATHMRIGETWPARLRTELEVCTSLVAIVSNDYLRSDWCLTEIDHARKLKKTILPFILEQVDPNLDTEHFQPRFKNTHWVRVDGNYEVAIRAIDQVIDEDFKGTFSDLIKTACTTHGITDASDLAEVLLHVLYYTHFPTVCHNLSLEKASEDQTSEPSHTLPMELANLARMHHVMNEGNANVYEGDPARQEFYGWYSIRMKCLENLLRDAMAQWDKQAVQFVARVASLKQN